MCVRARTLFTCSIIRLILLPLRQLNECATKESWPDFTALLTAAGRASARDLCLQLMLLPDSEPVPPLAGLTDEEALALTTAVETRITEVCSRRRASDSLDKTSCVDANGALGRVHPSRVPAACAALHCRR
jgi:hypothetical protein